MAAGTLRAKRRADTLHAMGRAILPETVDDDEVRAIVEDVIDEAQRAPRDRQLALGLFLDLLDGPLFVRSIGGSAAPLSKLSRAEVESVLRALSTSPIKQLRNAFHAVRRGVCFVAYGSARGATNPLWTRMGYPGPRDDRPALRGVVVEEPLPTTPASEVPREADVVVIGSGAGGGVAAAIFARRGLRVVLLEEGEPVPASAVSQREVEAHRRMFLDRGATTTDDLGLTILAGRALGGGTVVNWSASLRLDDEVARHWDHVSGLSGLGASLAPHYDAVTARLGLRTAEDNANNAALRRGCERLGWSVSSIPRNASGCGAGCGFCTYGCAYGNKRDVARTWLRDAIDADVAIVPSASATRVVLAEGAHARVLGVDWVGKDGVARFVRAAKVVVAAGALRTPKILARSGVRARAVGRHLHLHPTSPVFGVFDQPIEPWLGPPMTTACRTTACREKEHVDRSFGVVLEVGPAHPGLASVAVPWTDAGTHARDLEALARTAVVVAITRDRDSGAVTSDDVPRIRYRLSRHDGRHLLEGVAAGAEALLAAGAREVYTAHAPSVRLSRAQASERAIAAFRDDVLRAGCASGRLAVFSAHQRGSARMSARADGGVVDERGAVHGVRGLLVCDASVFPAASGVNPMLTIMAMAHRIATLHAA